MAFDSSPEGLRRRRTRRPLLAVAAFGWLGLVLMQFSADDSASANTGGSMDHHGMSHDPLVTAGGSGHTHDGFGMFALMWVLMLLAMMAPMVITQLRHVRDQSHARRRASATVEFLAGYTAVGLVLGAVAWGAWTLLGNSSTVVVGVAVALVFWQVTPLKQLCLNGHAARPSLRVFSPGTHYDVVRFGFTAGLWAFGGCWAFMLLPMYLGDLQIPVMVVASVWIWMELYEYPAAVQWGTHVPTRGIRSVGAAVGIIRRAVRSGFVSSSAPAIPDLQR